MKKYSPADGAKMIFLLLYFVILTAERIVSLVRIFMGDFSAYGALDWYMTALTVGAIIGAYAFILIKCLPAARNHPDGGVFGKLAVAAGILLLGGMVHTHGSIPPLQFVSYGMILISMAIHTAVKVKENGGGLWRWLSFGYIVAFSMAIPVVYPTEIELAWLFVPLEIVVSAGMVVLFTVMLRGFYNGSGEYSFPLPPLLAALVGDAAVLALRWNEEINFFVLIFICVAVVLFTAGKIVRNKAVGKG